MSNHNLRKLERPRVEIVIKLMPDGKVSVSGPLAQKDLCKEMLREAFRTVEAYDPPSIVVPEKPIIERVQ